MYGYLSNRQKPNLNGSYSIAPNRGNPHPSTHGINDNSRAPMPHSITDLNLDDKQSTTRTVDDHIRDVLNRNGPNRDDRTRTRSRIHRNQDDDRSRTIVSSPPLLYERKPTMRIQVNADGSVTRDPFLVKADRFFTKNRLPDLPPDADYDPARISFRKEPKPASKETEIPVSLIEFKGSERTEIHSPSNKADLTLDRSSFSKSDPRSSDGRVDLGRPPIMLPPRSTSRSHITMMPSPPIEEPSSPKTEEAVKPEPVKVEPPKVESPKIELPKSEPVKVELPKSEPVKVEPPKSEPVKVEPPKVESPKIELPKSEPIKVELPKVEPVKVESPKDTPAIVSETKIVSPVELPKVDLAPVKPVEITIIPAEPVKDVKIEPQPLIIPLEPKKVKTRIINKVEKVSLTLEELTTLFGGLLIKINESSMLTLEDHAFIKRLISALHEEKKTVWEPYFDSPLFQTVNSKTEHRDDKAYLRVGLSGRLEGDIARLYPYGEYDQASYQWKGPDIMFLQSEGTDPIPMMSQIDGSYTGDAKLFNGLTIPRTFKAEWSLEQRT